MSFQLKLHPGSKVGLVAICDVCGRQVTAADANLVWKHTNQKTGDSFHYWIVCKGACDDTLGHGEGKLHWQNLEASIGYLMNNLQLKPKAMRKALEFYAMFD